MKLKKIASLMLAGVMAVSMLAACGDSSSSSNEEGTTTPTVTTFTSTIYNKLDDVSTSIMSTKSNSYLADALEYAVSKLDTDMVNAAIAGADGEVLGADNGTDYNDVLLISINGAMNGTSGSSYTLTGLGSSADGSALAATDLAKDGKYIAVYQYTRSLSDTAIASNVAATIDGLMADLPEADGTATIAYYLTAESASVGSKGNGVVFVAVMIEVDTTNN